MSTARCAVLVLDRRLIYRSSETRADSSQDLFRQDATLSKFPLFISCCRRATTRLNRRPPCSPLPRLKARGPQSFPGPGGGVAARAPQTQRFSQVDDGERRSRQCSPSHWTAYPISNQTPRARTSARQQPTLAIPTPPTPLEARH